MSRYQIYCVAALVFFYVFFKTSATSDLESNFTGLVVGGVCLGLSDVGDLNAWQLDQLRRSAMAVVREEYPEGSFTPPAWMIAELQSLGGVADGSILRETYRKIGQRLAPDEQNRHVTRGREIVVQLRGPPQPVNGHCLDCDGTGKVGDGRVFVECLTCNGDGIIDDSDRKEGEDCNDSPTKESAGDQVSRSTGSVKPVRRNYKRFSVFRRLFGG